MLIGRPNLVKMLVLSNLPVDSNETQPQFQQTDSKDYYREKWKPKILLAKGSKKKILWRGKRPQMANTILKEEQKLGRIDTIELHDYCKDTVMKTVWYWWRNKQIDQLGRMESPVIEPSQMLTDLWQRIKGNSVEKGKS